MKSKKTVINKKPRRNKSKVDKDLLNELIQGLKDIKSGNVIRVK